MSGAMESNRVSLSPAIMLEIEEALNCPGFFGIPVGATINDALTLANNSGKWTWSWRSSVTHLLHLRYWYERLLQRSIRQRDIEPLTGRIVFTMYSKRADLNALMLPLVENYGADESIVLSPFSSTQAQLPAQTPFLLCDGLSKFDIRVWRREFARCAPTWQNRLNQVNEKHTVPKNLTRFLLHHLEVQTRRIMEANRLLDAIKPKTVVTEFDRGSRASCLVLAARQRRIPVVTMVHGALTPYPSYGYAPILADYVCCWGALHQQNLMDHGVDRTRLALTGCQSLSREIEAKRDLALMKIGLPADKPVILLATSPINLSDRKKYAQVFCNAMCKLPAMIAVVRLHPSENISDYQELLNEFPSVQFLSNTALSRDEALAATDLVVMHESGFGNEALLKGKLVAILDVLTTPLRMGREFIEMAGCPSARNAEELEAVISRVITDVSWRSELLVKAEEYVRSYCSSYGQVAVNNVCRVIDHAVENCGLIRKYDKSNQFQST